MLILNTIIYDCLYNIKRYKLIYSMHTKQILYH